VGTLRRFPDLCFALAVGVLLAALTLEAGGGLQLAGATRVAVFLQLTGGVLGALAIVLTPRERRSDAGLPALLCFALLAAITLLSIIWAVDPHEAWLETTRTLGYLGTFAAGLAMVRLWPERWTGLLGAILVACAIVSFYALLTKVLPGRLAEEEIYARLREPFGYWNAVGLMAALGIPACLWLGARRTGHAGFNALAYPVCGLLLVAMLLCYSRGSLLAAAVGCAFWFACVPLRLRGVAVLATSAAAAIPVALWAFAQDGLTTDRIALDIRESAGHQLGVALFFMTIALLAAGLAIGFASARRAPALQTRQAAGMLIGLTLALVPITGAIALSLSERGLGGSISNGWTQLTDPHASIGAAAANRPDRLTAVGSARARYFNDALKIFKEHKILGVGAGGYGVARLKVRADDLDVRHAHGYIFQTIADLGLLGLAASLALLAAWLAAAGRATGMVVRRNRLSRPGFWDLPFGPERVGLLTLFSIVVVYTVHSLVDWSWFIPGPTAIAVLAAGWLAGRGGRTAWSEWLSQAPAIPRRPVRERLRAVAADRVRAGIAAAFVLVAIVVAWSSWQPLRAVHVGDDSLALLGEGKVDEARKAAQRAHRIDPLSIEPLTDLAFIEDAAGRKDAARAAFQEAVHLQSSNPAPWLTLAQFELAQGDVAAAKKALGPALYLDPRSPSGVTLFLDAERRTSTNTAPPTP
jgi:tetratricopeptide (TPR) repeat protein